MIMDLIWIDEIATDIKHQRTRTHRRIYLDVVGDTMLFFSCTMSFISILRHFSFLHRKHSAVILGLGALLPKDS